MGHSARREPDDGLDLALQRVLVLAEKFAFEAHVLLGAGFAPVPVAGLEQTVWRKQGRLYATRAALEEVGIIRDQKEG